MRQLTRVLLLGVVAVACGDERAPSLTQTERQLLSTGYADSIRTISARVDSLCEADMSSLTAYLADSIYEVRLADIERQQILLQR